MAKKSGTSSWLTAVKRAFRSPTKDNTAEKKSHTRRDDNNQYHEQEEYYEDQKKREKRRWLFRKPAQNFHAKNNQPKSSDSKANDDIIEITKDVMSNTPALARAPAPAPVAEAAPATGQAAVEMNILRLARHNNNNNNNNNNNKGFSREQYCYAAIVIQTSFRGYLARRALRALRGLVKLQALVRGQNVRKQAKLTLKCMQALVRVQDQVSHQRARLSLESTRKSMLSQTTTSLLWDSSTCLHDIRDRVSISKEVKCGDDWDDCPKTSEQIEARLQVRKEAALQREKALAYAFSQQIRKARRSPAVGNEEEIEETYKWLDRWMATKQWENDYLNNTTKNTERRDQNIRTVEMDTSWPHYSSHSPTTTARRAQQTPAKAQPRGPYSGPSIPSSPAHKAQCNAYSCLTPSPSKTRLLKVRSASPRCPKEDRCHSAAHTPSLGSTMGHCVMGSSGPAVPNYMAATESTKARARPNSTPRQRPSTPERDQMARGQGVCGGSSAKKRLSYNATQEPRYSGSAGFGGGNFGQHLRSPSFKSLQNGYFYGIESLSSCNDESIFGRDVSPCSTTDLRWLK